MGRPDRLPERIAWHRADLNAALPLPDAGFDAITPLARIDLARAAAEAGFAELKFAWTDDGGIPGLPRYRWQTISFGILGGRLFSDNLVLEARRAASSD